MATLIGPFSNLARNPAAPPVPSLRRVQDSLAASRYAVSGVNQSGVPNLTGAQVSAGVGAKVSGDMMIAAGQGVRAATSANLTVITLNVAQAWMYT